MIISAWHHVAKQLQKLNQLTLLIFIKVLICYIYAMSLLKGHARRHVLVAGMQKHLVTKVVDKVPLSFLIFRRLI
jgi:hypothetical protein